MFCGERTLLGEAGGHGVAASLRCKRWNCTDCVYFNRAKLEALVCQLGLALTFVTLTSNPHHLNTADDRARRLARSWPLLRRRLCRLFGARFHFVAVFEMGKRGEAHLHIALADCPIPPKVLKRLLSKWMAELTSAPNVDVRHSDDYPGGVAGLAHYMAKGPHKFVGCLRFWTSRGWRERLADVPFVLEGIASAPLHEVARCLIALRHIIISRSAWRLVTLHPFAPP